MRNARGFSIAFSTLLTLFIAFLNNTAAAQEVNSQVSEAAAFFSQLANNSSNPIISRIARDSLNRLQQTNEPRTRIEIPLLEQSDTSLVVPTLIEDKVMGTFVVDTGATYTVITPAMAARLGITVTPQTPRIFIITANGRIQAPIVTLKNITIGGLKVPSVQAVIQTIGTGDDLLLSGLLGMNFFNGMDLTVKQDRLIIDVHHLSQASAK